MRTAVTFLAHPPEACWRVFTDPSVLSGWVPGLRRARVIARAHAGLASEILFDFGESRTYSLVYTYDLANREVRWEPQLGKRDAVHGFARFEADSDPAKGPGTRMTYALEAGTGRTESERALGDLDVLIGAFARWMNDERR